MKQKEIDIILKEHKKWLSDNNKGIRADLWGADLKGADLREANLREAYLRGADLWGADLRGADLWEANLSHFYIIPEDGGFNGWKATKDHIIKIHIPDDAERVCSLVGRKCRASKVKTVAIFNKDGTPSKDTESIGRHDGKTKYIINEYTYPDKFDDNIAIECTHGIHFFVTKKEAMEW